MRLAYILAFIFISLVCSAQLTWQARSSMPDRGRYAAIAFALNGKIYCGLGTIGSGTYLNDFWEYDPAIDVWTQKANFPGNGRYAPASFAIDGKGYACMGARDNGSISSECYSYEPNTNTWSSIAPFPGSARYAAESFVINDVAYIACGNGGGVSSYKNDLWSYSPTTNTWTQRANFPGGNRDNVTAFSIGNFGYVGAGNDGQYNTYSTFWKYTPATNSWTSIANMPEARTVTTEFILEDEAYVGLGYSYQYATMRPGFFAYNPSSNSWSSFLSTSSNITLRTGAEAVELGDSIYLMIGGYNSGVHTSLHLLQNNIQDTTHISVVDTVYRYFDSCRVTMYDTVKYLHYDTIQIAIDDTLNIYASGWGAGCGDIKMQLYPNPTATYLNFYSSLPHCFEGSKLEIIDQLGQILQTHPYDSSVVAMDIRGYARSLYFVRLVTPSGNVVFSKKFVIH